MKNKLTKEEQLLRDKLDSVEFTYQDTHWAEVSKVISKKSFLTKYGTLTKAAIGFFVIATSVYLMSTSSDTTELAKAENITAQKVEQKENTKEISNKNVAITPVNSSKERKEQLKSVEPLKERGLNQENFSSPEVKESNEFNLKDEPIELESKINLTTDKELTEHRVLVAEIKDLELIGAPCLNQKIRLQVNTVHAEQSKLVWFVNQVKVEETAEKLELKLEEIGHYEISVQLLEGKKILSEKSISFDVITATEIDFTYQDKVEAFVDFEVALEAKPLGLSNYQWLINNEYHLEGQTASFDFQKEGIYDVSLIHKTKNGCEHKISKPVLIKTDFKPLVNAFSPNGDGHNDVFIPKVFTIVDASFQMTIFDVRGNTIYQTKTKENPWNGRRNNTGELMPIGSYVWKIKIENSRGKSRDFSGRVKIIGS